MSTRRRRSRRATLEQLRGAVDLLDLARSAEPADVVLVLSRREALDLLVLLAEVDGPLAAVVERIEEALDQ
jgi:hypothetical protein